MAGLVLVWSGLTPLSQHRDADGYLMSDPLTIDRSAHAVTTTDTDMLRGHYECAAEEALILHFFSPDDVRMRGSASSDDGIFVGIAPTEAVDRYLDGVEHDLVTDWDCDVDHITSVAYATREGDSSPAVPGSEPAWVATASGPGEQVLDWTVQQGDWTVVIMNADAARGVSAVVSFGALAPANLTALAWTSFAVGLVALIGGGRLLYLGLRRWRPTTNPRR